MEYEQFVEATSKLPFIQDQEKADAAVKAVLGILASKLEEQQAHQFTESLPEPLNYERLHSHQVRNLPISADEYINVIREQFRLDDIQASQLIQTTLHIAKEALQEDEIQQLTSHLPEDWGALIDAA